MSYQSLEELLKEHSDESVFRAAMSWLSIKAQAEWRAEYKREHGVYPTMAQSHVQRANSRYYLPPKTRVNAKCNNCGESCKQNEYKDWVCQNPKCFSFDS